MEKCKSKAKNKTRNNEKCGGGGGKVKTGNCLGNIETCRFAG